MTAADHFTIPGYCEQVIDVFIERFPEDDHFRNNDILVEPCDQFSDRYPLVMASTVVDIDSSPTQKVTFESLLRSSVDLSRQCDWQSRKV